MTARNLQSLVFLAIAGFLALAEANAFRSGISDYGTSGTPGWSDPAQPPAHDSLPRSGLDSLDDAPALAAPVFETDMQVLSDSQAGRTARRTRFARRTLGVLAVGGGSYLVYQGGRYLHGALVLNIMLSILGSEERAPAGPGAVMLFGGVGAVSLGTYWLLVPWKAERVPLRMGLDLHPSGKGAAIAFRF